MPDPAHLSNRVVRPSRQHNVTLLLLGISNLNSVCTNNVQVPHQTHNSILFGGIQYPAPCDTTFEVQQTMTVSQMQAHLWRKVEWLFYKPWKRKRTLTFAS